MFKSEMKPAKLFALCLVLFCCTRLLAGDLKVKQLVTTTYKTSESKRTAQQEQTIYVQGTRQRLDYRVPDTPDARQPHTAEILDCQKLSGYRVDLRGRKYAEVRLRGFPTEKQVLALARRQESWAKNRYAARTVESAERKMFFGMAAHHIITTIYGLTPNERSEATIDGWYVSLPEAGCSPAYMRQGPAIERRVPFLSPGAGKTVYTGFVPPGLAVQETVTTISRFEQNGFNNEVVTVVESKVIELSEELLDGALFNVPEGFEKVDRLPVDLNVPRAALRTR
ncbi:MAG TPA: hypothetical protein VKH81_03815 [Candidatus Angelobacter sp.]|nr:hypothetical protein [Candidatus Angelobacter sp.]